MSNHKIRTIDNLSLQEFDSDAELIPLLTRRRGRNDKGITHLLAILLIAYNLFPGVVIPITAGRDKSIKLIDDANAAGKIIGVVKKRG
jgi:ATP-dependent Lon protease